MFYKIPRNDTLAMSMFLKKIRNEPSENLNLNLMPNNYDFDTKAQTNKKYEWMLFIKTKVTNILTLNIVMSIVYIFFYFLKGFFIVKIFKSNIISKKPKIPFLPPIDKKKYEYSLVLDLDETLVHTIPTTTTTLRLLRLKRQQPSRPVPGLK